MPEKREIVTLFSGIIIGISFAFIFSNTFTTYNYNFKQPPVAAIFSNNITQHNKNELYHKGEATVAEKLAEQVRIVCWIMTMPDSHETVSNKSLHIYSLFVIFWSNL